MVVEVTVEENCDYGIYDGADCNGGDCNGANYQRHCVYGNFTELESK